MYSRFYDKRFGDPQLMGGLITALCLFSKEAMGGELQFMRSGDHYVIVMDVEPIKTIIVADDHDEVSAELMEEISLRFVSRYANEIKEGINIGPRGEFDAILDELIPVEKTALHRIEPTQPLDALALVDIPIELKDVALLIVREGSLTASRAASILEIDKENAKNILNRLVKQGFVGVQFDENEPVYFV